MLELDFKEPEQFKTPDGEIWVVNPLKRRDLKRLNKFTRLNSQLQEYQREGKADEGNKLIYGEDESDDEEETLLKITDDIIDLSITNLKTGEKLPEEYRRTITKSMELVGLVVSASIDSPSNIKGDDTPLQRASSGKASE